MILSAQLDTFDVSVLPSIIILGIELKEFECVPGSSFVINGRNFIDDEHLCFILGKAVATKFLSSVSLECSISMAINGQVGVDLVDHLGINSLHAGILNCPIHPQILSIQPSIGPVTGWILSIF
jgi:hypothetical protein